MPVPPDDPDIDPDVDLTDPVERREFAPPSRARLLAAIAVGGVLGALARAGVAAALPHDASGFPWSTLLVNVTGCGLIGVLMVVITERVRAHPLTRPVLGVGVLGGYTTFSTYAVEAVTAVRAGHPALAAGYVVATPLLAVLGVAAGSLAARAVPPRGSWRGRA